MLPRQVFLRKSRAVLPPDRAAFLWNRAVFLSNRVVPREKKG
jgi:hypothetical protein